MREIDKEKAYNTVALKYYELEQLKEVKENLLSMEPDCNAKVKIKTIHKGYAYPPHLYSKKASFEIEPTLLIQIIDGLIENKKEYLDKAIDVSLLIEKEGK